MKVRTSPTPARRRLTTVLGATAVAGLMAAVCSACSTASPVAMVNGQAISQSEFDQQLQTLAASSAYVTEFDTEESQYYSYEKAQAKEQGESSTGLRLVTQQGTGSGPEDYSLEWAVIQLDRNIDAAVVSQYLAKEHRAPSSDDFWAAWAAEDALNSTAWRGFTPQLRTQLARADANHALLETKLADASDDASFYKQVKAYFWSRVCVNEVDVAVVDPATGTVNTTATKRLADKDAQALSSGVTTAGSLVGNSGARYCLTPEQLIERPAVYLSAVGALAPGKAVAIPGSDDYQVVMVRSRALLPYNRALEQVIDVVQGLGGYQAIGYNDDPVIKLLKGAKITVNPEYGAWDEAVPSPASPQVASAGSLASYS